MSRQEDSRKEFNKRPYSGQRFSRNEQSQHDNQKAQRTSKKTYLTCKCGAKAKPLGSGGVAGHLRYKCSTCKKTTRVQVYRGALGLVL